MVKEVSSVSIALPARQRRRRWKIVVGALAIPLLLLLVAAWPGSSTYTIGTETTYVTGPLDKHGDIDFVAALNERLRKNITPQNNANVLIWQALGPHPEGATMPAEYFQWLGIESPPEKGEYFVSWMKYQKEKQAKPGGNIEPKALGNSELRAPNQPWTAKDNPDLAGWLKRNEKPLMLVMEATRRPEYYNPPVPKRTEDWSPGLLAALLPTVQKCREVAAALVSRSMLRLAEGKVEEAWQDLLACHRLGRLVARGGCLIEMLVGIAIEQVANHADVGFLDQAKCTSKQIMASWEDLRKLPPMPSIADEIDLGERFMFLDTTLCTIRLARRGAPFLEGILEASKPPKGDSLTSRLFTRSINWDPALRNGNRRYDRYAAVLRIADRKERLQEIEALTRDLRNLKQQVTERRATYWFGGAEDRGDWLGNLLIGLLTPAINKVQDAADRGEQGQRNLSIAYALTAYQRDKGRYPAKLDELAPTYLKKIPNDLFSDQPLLYRLEDKGYLLYSVGPNGMDDDGRGPNDDPPGDDLSIRIPVRPQKG